MLLFLLSFYLHYDYINCEENLNAKFNESSIVDKQYKSLLQVHDLLKDMQPKIDEMSALIEDTDKQEAIRNDEFPYISNLQESDKFGKDQKEIGPNDHKTHAAVFHPSPQYDPLPIPFDRRQGLSDWLSRFYLGSNHPIFIPPTSSSNFSTLFPSEDLGQRPPYPGYLLIPINSLYSGMVGPGLPTYQSVYLKPPGPSMSSNSYALNSARLVSNIPTHYTELDNVLQKLPKLINPQRSTISSPILPTALTSTRTSGPVDTSSSLILTRTKGKNAMIWFEAIAPYTKTKMKKDLKHQLAESYSEKTTKSVATRGAKINAVTGTENTLPWNTNDEHEQSGENFTKKQDKPVLIPEEYKKWVTKNEDAVYGNNSTQKSSTISLKERYHQLMDQLHEGYMMVFLLEFCRLVALKNELEVQNVLLHTKLIYTGMWNNGRLAWISDPLRTVIWKLSKLVSEEGIDRVRSKAAMMFHMLLERGEMLSSEVNSIIDEAGQFFTNVEGYDLLYTLKEFEDHPNIIKSDYWLCNSLMESFLRPFRQSSVRRRTRLLKSINNAIEKRFPLVMATDNGTTLVGEEAPKNGSQPRKRRRKRKRKRSNHPHKRKRHRGPLNTNKPMYGRQHSRTKDYENQIVNSMKPLTK